MADAPLNQVVRLTAWNVSQDAARGQSYGTCITAMNSMTSLKLMRVADEEFLRTTPEPARFFLPEDQLFALLPASNGGFRILKFQTDICLEGDAWFANASGKRVRFLALNPLDETSQSQVFFAAKGEGFAGVDAYKLFCMLDGERFDLTADRDPSKEFVDLALLPPGAPAGDLYALQPQPQEFTPASKGPSPVVNLKMTNRLGADVSFEVRWNGGASPPLFLQPGGSGTITLDGVKPPAGTSCRVAARAGRKLVQSDNFTAGPATHNPYMEYILVEFTSPRGRKDIGFEAHFHG